MGGAPYLHTLMASVPTAANAGYYARIVAEKAILRRLVEAGTRIVQMGYCGRWRPSSTRSSTAPRRRYTRSQSGGPARTTPARGAAAAHARRDGGDRAASGALHGVPTGFADLDRCTNGLHPGQLIVVAARPGIGKSTLALDFARHGRRWGTTDGVIFSLEMTKVEITMRLLSAEARVHLQNLRCGRMSDEDWHRRSPGGSARWRALRCSSTTSPNLTMMEIRAKARRLKQRHDLRLLIVDYLQLMTSGGGWRAASRRSARSPGAEAAGQGARGAGGGDQPAQPWAGAADGQAPHAQRPPGVRGDRAGRRRGDPVAPRGSYEHESPRAGEADFIVAKHRNGPTDTVAVAAQLHYSRFVDMAIV